MRSEELSSKERARMESNKEIALKKCAQRTRRVDDDQSSDKTKSSVIEANRVFDRAEQEACLFSIINRSIKKQSISTCSRTPSDVICKPKLKPLPHQNNLNMKMKSSMCMILIVTRRPSLIAWVSTSMLRHLVNSTLLILSKSPIL